MKLIFGIIKGFFIGLALVIPGLSASTFAVVMGLYDRLIASINNLRTQFKDSMKFLLPLGIGAAVGILASAGLFVRILERFPLPSYAFFIGLVLGSVPLIYQKIKPDMKSKSNYIIGFIAFGIIAALGFIVPTDDVVAIEAIGNIGHVVQIFTAGVISCFSLAVPGVSGSLIVILLGQYGTVYGAVSNFADVIMMAIRGQSGAMELGLDSGLIILVFGLGAIVGLITAAKIIGYLLQRSEVKVYFAVMGLMFGAVVTLFMIGVADHIAAPDASVILNIGLIAVFGVVGYICTKLMSKFENRSEG